MGGILSDDGPPSRELQQQRGQLLLLSQFRDNRAVEQWAAEGGLPIEGFPALRPTEQPGLRQTQVLKNPLHVKGRSIRLRYRPLVWELSFMFDALVPCEVLVYMGTKEGPPAEDAADWAPAESAWASEPVAREQVCLGQEFRSEVHVGDFPSREAYGGCTSSLGFCIELRASASSGDGAGAQAELRATEWTMGRFLHRSPEGRVAAAAGVGLGGPSVSVELQSQRVRLPGPGLAESYEMHEVFGAEQFGPAVLGQDCVICMSETRDTAVLPCRHMCLCGGCAETMRSRVQYRSYRCPICRERVSSLLQISKLPQEEAEQAAEESPPAAEEPPAEQGAATPAQAEGAGPAAADSTGAPAPAPASPRPP